MKSSNKVKEVFLLREDFNGQGMLKFAWSPDNSYIAVCGANNLFRVLDRHGKKDKEIMLESPNKVATLQWDKDSTYCAIMQESLNYVTLYSTVTKTANKIDIISQNQKDKVTFIRWSKNTQDLVIGTEKGMLEFYYKKAEKKVPCVGKHSKKVVCGEWNKMDLLVTGSEDKLLTVSDKNGNSVSSVVILPYVPLKVEWCKCTFDEKEVICLLSNNTINIVNLNLNKILEFKFDPSYGKITSFKSINEQYVVVGFSYGVISVLTIKSDSEPTSVNMRLFGNTAIESISVDTVNQKIAVCSSTSIKFISFNNWKELVSDQMEIGNEYGALSTMEYSGDGQIIGVSTTTGSLLGVLAVVPCIYDTWNHFVLLLTSLSEVSLFNCQKKELSSTLSLDMEPTFVKLSTYHLAIGQNNIVSFYRWKGQDNRELPTPIFIQKKVYNSAITAAYINSKWAVVHTNNTCVIHLIEPKQGQYLQERKLPQQDADKYIGKVALTEDFIIYQEINGKLKYALIEDGTVVVEHKQENPVISIFPNKNGSKCVLIDITGCGYIYTPTTDQTILLPNFSGQTEKILWDMDDANLFCTVESDKLQEYLYCQNSLEGPTIIQVQEYLKLDDIDAKKINPVVSKLEEELKPIILKNGYLYIYSKAEQIKGQYLSSHSYLNQWKGEQDPLESHFKYFLQNMALHRYLECIKPTKFCDKYGIKMLDTLGRQCLKFMEQEVAHYVYEELQNAGMVDGIESILNESEKYVIVGKTASLLQTYDLAEEMYLKSTRPDLALSLRCDLNDWTQALKLAQQINESKVPFISRKLAVQLENQNSITEARSLFEKALIQSENPTKEMSDHNLQCLAGMARTHIRLGDVSKALKIAASLTDNRVIIDIASVCESMKQYLEAADLYAKAGLIEKAASLYIQIKQLKQAAALLQSINSPKLLRELAKAKETEKNYKEAELAYEKANDWENVIRINVKYLDNVDKAKKILRSKCPTPTCAMLLAEYEESKNNKKEAIEFLIMGGKREEAFVIAQSHDEMDKYADVISTVDSQNTDEHLRIAQFYEGKNMLGKAAKEYEKSDNQHKALKLYIQGGEACISDAIKMVGKAKNESLTHQLLDYLMGEVDGVAKDPAYTLEVYRVQGNIRKVFNIALTIATNEQEVGNYKMAHQILFQTMQDMRTSKEHVPLELAQKLHLLHSYMLAKRYIKIGDHMHAARLLLKVVSNISQFSMHAVPILTTTVAECSKANLKAAAYQWACVLVRPENRGNIQEAYKKRIENIARRPVTEEDPIEQSTPCPYCKNPIPELSFSCPNCKNSLPFCIASGKHMILSEWTKCPNCKFCAILSDFKRVLESDNTCPLCDTAVNIKDLVQTSDTADDLKSYQFSTKIEEEKEEIAVHDNS